MPGQRSRERSRWRRILNMVLADFVIWYGRGSLTIADHLVCSSDIGYCPATAETARNATATSLLVVLSRLPVCMPLMPHLILLADNWRGIFDGIRGLAAHHMPTVLNRRQRCCNLQAFRF